MTSHLQTLSSDLAGLWSTWFVHSVILCLLALLLGRWIPRARVREALYKAALVGALVSTGWACTFGSRDLTVSSGPSTQGMGVSILPAVVTPVDGGGEPISEAVPVSAMSPAVPALQLPWVHLWSTLCLGVLVLGIGTLLRDHRRLQRLLARRRPVEDEGWLADLVDLTRTGGLRRTPELASSADLATPIALARGLLVVPERALVELDGDQRRALLAHELAHLVRRDPQWLLVTLAIERLLALQFLQRPVRRRLVEEIEQACDDEAVRWTGGGLGLARCLGTVASWLEGRRTPALAASMAVGGSALVRRVERALAPGQAPDSAGNRVLGWLGMGVLVATLASAGPRIEAGGQEPDSESTIVATLTDEDTPRLEVRADGTVHAEGRLLYDPEVEDFALLDEHLASLAKSMESRPLNPEEPSGPRLAMGELILHASEAAPMRSLQKVMEHCGNARIWRIRFASAEGDKEFKVPLPVDDEAAPVEIEAQITDAWDDAPTFVRPRTEVRIQVLEPGTRVDPSTGLPWSGEGRYVYDGSRKLQYKVGQESTTRLNQLTTLLHAVDAQRPDGWEAVIDARNGVVYKDVVQVLDVVIATGCLQVTFVGAYPASGR